MNNGKLLHSGSGIGGCQAAAQVHPETDRRAADLSTQDAERTWNAAALSDQLVYLRLEAEGVRLLPLAARHEVARAVVSKPEMRSVTVAGGSALVIELEHTGQAVEQELKRLRKVQAMVIPDPEIMLGTPVFKGTRIPVELVAGMAARGTSIEEILAGYPALRREQVELAALYLAAFPRRGRPAQRPWATKKQRRIIRKRPSAA